MTLKVGALFAGYGGIELALGSILDTKPAWFSEFDKAPSAILAHHWPDVPNLGDVTKIDWAAVEPVDIITGGSPCQDLSHAGKRAGMKAGTRSGLWASMCDAIETIRPKLVVWENVRGAYSAEATSAVEPCPICVGDGGRVSLRALGRVLGDLAELGYDARWYGLRAADVGAAHGRFRVFLFATPADSGGLGGLEAVERDGRGASSVHGSGLPDEPDRDALRVGPVGVPGQLVLLKTPTSQLAVNGGSQHPDKRKEGGHGPTLADEVEHLLPTPRATRGGSGTETLYGLGAERSDANRPQGEVLLPPKLLPTPAVADTRSGEHMRTDNNFDQGGSHGVSLHHVAYHANEQDWREYEAAIRRQEAVFGRPAPLPTEPGAKGQPRLSPRFVEWLMGLPEGHVTDPTIGISRNDQLKALGNGVVPQQCAAALRAFLTDTAAQERAS